MKRRLPQQKHGRSRAFTMVELLTVIAIIAILAALLFPVLATVREQARQSNTMSSLQAVYQGAKLYYEDEGRYPTSLYGYAEVPDNTVVSPDPPFRPALPGDVGPTPPNIIPMDKIKGVYATNTDTPSLKKLHTGSLFPEQVKAADTFVNVNNPIKNKQAVTVAYYPISVGGGTINNGVFSGGTLVTWRNNQTAGSCTVYGDRDIPNSNYVDQAKVFYTMDSMDIGPMLDADGRQAQLNDGTPVYELHYTPDWTHLLGTTCDVDGSGAANVRQLKYRNPPTDKTILTWVTHHAAHGGSPNVMVLFLSGTARKVNYQDAAKMLPMNYK